VFGWILVKANDTFLRAVNWAYDSIQNALSVAWGWVISRYNDLRNFVDYTRSTLLSQISGVYEWVRGQIAAISSTVNGWVQYVIDVAARWVTDLRHTVEGWIQLVIDTSAALVRASQDWAAAQINVLTGDIASIRSLIFGQNSAGTGVLTTFLSNPLGFIMAYVWDKFTDLLCFSLAYGFGTVKYDLPPLPDWNGGGVTGGAGGAFPIPISSGELFPPLSDLSVSGYIFSPSHPGVDFGLSDGQPVYAAHNGVIGYAGWSSAGYGFTVTIQSTKWWSRYAHLKVVSVGAGQEIKAGEVIGLGNSTGNSTGPHLHFEIKRNGQFIDPLTVL
jgi:murein DD-endopeptidase MepM/ murein hydrolase activator NlpD